MGEWADVEQRFQETLGLTRRPVAVAFRDARPAGLEPFQGSAPAGCTFWQLASAGRAVATTPADHYNCPIGSYTHNLPLPPERAPELEQTLGLMVDVGYLRLEEVPSIPRLPQTPGALLYAPLGDAPFDPDVVLVAGRPGRVMLLYEAALRAGALAPQPLLGRPACMALPAALAHGVVVSTGCIGNRVYTDIGDDELYVAIPGKDVRRVAAALATIGSANATLDAYHRQRRATLTSE